MKKKIWLIFSVLLTICCLAQICSAASISASQAVPIVEEPLILSSYSLNVNNACDHSYTHTAIGDVVGESCTDTIYNYTVRCRLCNQDITGGTLSVPKNPAEHTMSWYSVSCVRGTHTYERRCSKCGYATESFSRACSGPPCPEVMALTPCLY